LQYVILAAAVVATLFCLPSYGAARPMVHPMLRSVKLTDVPKPLPEPLKLPNSALEPIDWNALGGWVTDDHAAAFATFVTSCRPLLRTVLSKSETRPMYLALMHVCRQALAAGRPTAEQARMFFERNFRPLRITKLWVRTLDF
jgi:membrane-bound lytic murein transglycosylase A